MPEDPSVDIREGTYAELADWLEPGTVGVATDTNMVLFLKRNNNSMQPITDGLYATPPVVVTAARACVPGDTLVLNAGAAPTLPLLAESLSNSDPLATPAPAWQGASVKMHNATSSAINVATGAGASINGASTGTPYSLGAGVTAIFTLDSSGTNWVVM